MLSAKQEACMAIIEATRPEQPHARITRMWREWQIESGQTQQVIVIEVDLETDPSSASFDSGELDDIVDAAVSSISAGRGDRADFRVRLVPAKKP